MRLDGAPKLSSTTSTARSTRSSSTRAGQSSPVWRWRHASGFSAGRLALMRLSRGRPLLLAVGLGMLVAVVLVCTVPLYNALIANVQLQSTLNSADPISRNLEVELQSPQVDTQVRAATTQQETALAQRYLSGFTESTATYFVAADTMLAVAVGHTTFDLANRLTPQLAFESFDYAALAPHMRVLAGHMPQAVSAGPPQAMITDQMAHEQHLVLGDTITTTQFGDHTKQASFIVAGIWTPTNAREAFWNGQSFVTSSVNGPPTYTVLLTFASLFSNLSQFNSVGMTQHWIYYTQPQRITVDHLATTLSDISTLRSRVNGDLLGTGGVSAVTVASKLDTLLAAVQQEENLLSLPLYVVAVQVVGLALLFVAAMASLLIEGQSQDIATLKSRGESGTQILGVFITQGALLGLFAIIIGPFVAALVTLALVQRFLPGASSAEGGFLAKIATPQTALVPAVVGGVLGVGAVAFATWQAARMDILAFRREQARPTRAPLWRRYYLDVALAVLCLIGYYELDQFGSASTRLAVSSTNTNPLLLAAPALLLVAGALIVLRLVPLAAALGARISTRGRGLTSVLAFEHVERSPARYARLTLLLVLAVGLGLFALTFNATLTRNVADRAAYSNGADIRVVENVNQGGALGPRDVTALKQMPGVLGVTPIYRTIASTTQDLGSQTLDVLAIDPATFASVGGTTSWRADYATESLDTLMAGMRAHLAGQSAGSASHPIAAVVSQTFANQLSVRLGDRFAIAFSDSIATTTNLVVGAIVQDFPTLYPQSKAVGFIVVPLSDYLNAIAAASPNTVSTIGPNEFWLRTTEKPSDDAALRAALNGKQAQLSLGSVSDLADVRAAGEANPVSAGMRGLLLVGALTAAVLAVLGSLIQSVIAARQRTTSFAVLRTIGMANAQITRLLLGEQLVVYAFGLIGGTILGILLTAATLPYLQFSDTAVNAATLGVPPYVLAFNGGAIAIFYAALIAAFLVALAVAGRYAAQIGLGKALRLGED
jgi:putative ABC transport system permease protein